MTKTLTAAIDTAARRAGRLRAVDYLRVSTEDQAKGYGIAYTGKKTVRHIERKDWDHVDTFADEGVSGALEAHERPDLKRLMEMARQTPRPFDVVVVPEGRAIGRTGKAFWRWVWELEELGVFVAVVKGDYDNTTSEGRKKMRRDADYAEDEREIIRDRTQGGAQEKAEDGGHFGGPPPYGWRIENKGVLKESRLILDECDCDAECRTWHTAAVLRVVWDLIVNDGMNCRTAAARLNTLGIPTSADKPWTSNGMRRILKGTPVQKGLRIFRNPDTAAGKKGTKLDSEGAPVYGETVTVNLDPVFTEEEVRRLNAAMGRTARQPFTKEGIHPLSKHVFNAHTGCGKHYTGVNRTRNANRAYRCSGKVEKYPGAPKCACSQVDADALEKLVWGEVCKLLGDPERLRAMSEDWVAMSADSRIDHAARLEDLDRKIEAQGAAMDAVMGAAAKTAALTGRDPQKAIQEAISPLMQELGELQKLRTEAAAWAEDAMAAQTRARDLKELAEMARTRLHDMQPAEQAKVLALLDVRVTILGDIPQKARKDDQLYTWFQSRGRTVPVLTDEAWALVEPVFTNPRGGRPATSPRRHLEAMLHKVRTGCAWRDLPAEYGAFGSIATSARRWTASGLWGEAMERLAEVPGTILPADGVVLPPVRVEGRIDPRLLVSTQATPGDNRPCGHRPAGVIRFQMHLAA